MKPDPRFPRVSPKRRRERDEAIRLMLIEYKNKQLTLDDAPIIEPTANQKAIALFERLINECKAMDLI